MKQNESADVIFNQRKNLCIVEILCFQWSVGLYALKATKTINKLYSNFKGGKINPS
jgi:hypothetical protein